MAQQTDHYRARAAEFERRAAATRDPWIAHAMRHMAARFRALAEMTDVLRPTAGVTPVARHPVGDPPRAR